jgi:ABC-type sulfate transport system permease component
VYIFGQIQNESLPTAAAVSVALLFVALVVLAALNFISQRQSRHVL